MSLPTDDRAARLAAALRANLRKRKERDAAPLQQPVDGKGPLNE